MENLRYHLRIEYNTKYARFTFTSEYCNKIYITSSCYHPARSLCEYDKLITSSGEYQEHTLG